MLPFVFPGNLFSSTTCCQNQYTPVCRLLKAAVSNGTTCGGEGSRTLVQTSVLQASNNCHLFKRTFLKIPQPKRAGVPKSTAYENLYLLENSPPFLSSLPLKASNSIITSMASSIFIDAVLNFLCPSLQSIKHTPQHQVLRSPQPLHRRLRH